MKVTGKRKLWILIVVVVAMSAFTACYIYFSMLVWTPFCCTYDDVDISTGRIRHIRYLLYCKISERIEDSILTRVLTPEFVDGVQPAWHRVNTFSPGVGHSPHHAFHGAISQIGRIAAAWKMAGFSEEAKQQVARNLLKIWQSDGSYFGARAYVNDVLFLADKASESDATISESDLPPPEAR